MFLRSIEGWGTSYCLQVLSTSPTDWDNRLTHMHCRRWGIDAQGQPFDDGHHNDNYFTAHFRPIGQRAWRFGDRGCSGRYYPAYFRQITVNPTKGQLDLFT